TRRRIEHHRNRAESKNRQQRHVQLRRHRLKNQRVIASPQSIRPQHGGGAAGADFQLPEARPPLAPANRLNNRRFLRSFFGDVGEDAGDVHVAAIFMETLGLTSQTDCLRLQTIRLRVPPWHARRRTSPKPSWPSSRCSGSSQKRPSARSPRRSIPNHPPRNTPPCKNSSSAWRPRASCGGIDRFSCINFRRPSIGMS